MGAEPEFRNGELAGFDGALDALIGADELRRTATLQRELLE